MTLVDEYRDVATPAELEELAELEERVAFLDELEADWQKWLVALCPEHFAAGFAPHHAEFWEWVWRIEPDVRPEVFVGIWARGGAKSTSAEAACVALGARGKRRYGLYVCDTQDRADDHVGNVAALLESDSVDLLYPDLGERRVGKHGNSKGWRRNRVWTASGFVIDAIGLDVAGRGVKLEDQRPDFIVIDDVDGEHDSRKVTKRKVETLTQSVIPAGAPDLAILAIQNLVQPNGVFARLANDRADFLRRRRVSGPVPALRSMTVDDQGVLHGEPTWEGQNLERCREMADDMGLRAFRKECQHDVADVEGALWATSTIDEHRCTVEDVPVLVRSVVAIDPSTTDEETSDEAGIIVAARGPGPLSECHAYVLADRSKRTDVESWGKRGAAAYHEFNSDVVVGETNNGGDMVGAMVKVADRSVPFKKVHASRGKAIRAQPIADLYADGRVHHVGMFPELEEQLTTWTPESGESPDRLDALVWALTELMVDGAGSRRSRFRGAAA